MGNWSELPLDVAAEIVEKVEYYEDFVIGFGGVCKNWRKAMKLATRPTASRRTPWLLLPEPPKDGQWGRSARLYSLDKERVVLELDLPYSPATQLLDNDSIDLRPLFVQEKWRYVSTRGWLVYIDDNFVEVTLVHPLSNQIIACPPIPSNLSKELRDSRNPSCHSVVFALSHAPCTTSQDSHAMIKLGHHSVAVWSSTENEWLVRKFPTKPLITDVTFFNGYLYFVCIDGKVVEFATEKEINHERRLWQGGWAGCVYLVGSAEKLLMVRRRLTKLMGRYWTAEFKVWEVNVDDGHTKQVDDIGDIALFVGYNSTFSINTSNCSNVWSNCIYYVGDNGVARDMGIYDLRWETKIKNHYSPSDLEETVFPPPVWVESTYSTATT